MDDKDQTVATSKDTQINIDFISLKRDITSWCHELGFQKTGIAEIASNWRESLDEWNKK